MFHSRTLQIAAAAALAFAVTAPAFAEEVAPSKGVKYGDLDLTKDSDVAKLNGRIRFAAMDVCGADRFQPFSQASRAAQRCIWRARNEAKVHTDTVVAMARSGNVYAAADRR